MSLKAVHIAFIVCATLLAAGFGVWALERPEGGGYRVIAGLSFAVAASLVVYGVWFVKKLRGVSYL